MDYLNQIVGKFKPLHLEPHIYAALLRTWIVLAVLRLKDPDLESPLLLFQGVPGSAKTTLAREVGRLVNADDSFEVDSPPDEEEHFWLIAKRKGVVVFDNLDAAVPRYFPGAVARAITGGQFRRRTLYEDDALTEFRANASIAVSTIQADLLRGDILDRCLPLRVAPLETFIPKMVLNQDLAALREGARSEIQTVVEAVWNRLKTPQPVGDGRLRIADFAHIGRIVAQESGDKAIEVFESALAAIPSERMALAMDSDALLAALVLIAEDPKTAGKELSFQDLIAALCEKHELSKEFSFSDPQRFGIAVRQLRDKCAGIVRIETVKKRAGVRYRIKSGR